MNINGLNNKIIDVESANKISGDLFSVLQKKSVDYSKADLTKFNRPTMGVDLYSQKGDLNVQRQIALTNSGLMDGRYALNSVRMLNSFAAQQLYAENVVDAVDGKMTIDAIKDEVEFISKAEEPQASLDVFNTEKDKKDSNPFYFGNFFSNEGEKQN